MAIDELAWHRLRYRFAFDSQGQPPLKDTESISANSAHAGRPYPGPAIVSERRAGGRPRDRDGFEERADRRTRVRMRIELAPKGHKARVCYSRAV